MYGTDFESIARVMPGRTRHEVRNKFNAEDRRNPQLINDFLFKPKPIGKLVPHTHEKTEYIIFI